MFSVKSMISVIFFSVTLPARPRFARTLRASFMRCGARVRGYVRGAALGKSRQATRLSGAAFLRKARRQGDGVLEVRRAAVDNALRKKASRAGVEVAAISPGQSPLT